MPVLVMALLALMLFGLIGIMLLVAAVMEHFTLARAAKTEASQHVNPGATPTVYLSIDKLRGEDAPTENSSPKENVHEHACTG